MSSSTSQERKRSSLYRAVEYHDGQNLRIEERRRRSPVAKLEGVSPGSLRDSEKQHASNPIKPELSTSVNVQNANRRPHTAHVVSDDTHHVTNTKPRIKPILIQETKGRSQILTRKGHLTSESTELPTPPPTPRLGRLPTPELSDLEESPFCDCCVETKSLKYCASCGNKINKG